MSEVSVNWSRSESGKVEIMLPLEYGDEYGLHLHEDSARELLDALVAHFHGYESFEDAMDQATLEGYDEGFDNGNEEAYEIGREDGAEDAYNEGYEDGYAARSIDEANEDERPAHALTAVSKDES